MKVDKQTVQEMTKFVIRKVANSKRLNDEMWDLCLSSAQVALANKYEGKLERKDIDSLDASEKAIGIAARFLRDYLRESFAHGFDPDSQLVQKYFPTEEE